MKDAIGDYRYQNAKGNEADVAKQCFPKSCKAKTSVLVIEYRVKNRIVQRKDVDMERPSANALKRKTNSADNNRIDRHSGFNFPPKAFDVKGTLPAISCPTIKICPETGTEALKLRLKLLSVYGKAAGL